MSKSRKGWVPVRDRRDWIPNSVPPKIIPFVKLVYSLMMKRQVSYGEVAEESGLSMQTLVQYWRRRGNPSVANIEAALNTLGYKLAAVPMVTELDDLGRVVRLSKEELPLKGKGRGNFRSSKRYQLLQEAMNDD